MLIDLISNRNLVTFNAHVANLIGLHPAIYLSELLCINDRAIHKEKTNNSFFILDRDYISKRTTFSIEEQKEIESKLETLGVLVKDPFDNDSMHLITENVVSLLMSEDEKLISNVKSIIQKPAKKVSKTEQMITTIQQAISVSNQELRAAYLDWVDSAIRKSGWLSKSAVIDAQKMIDTISGRDLDIAIAIVRIAATNGYRDMQWAVKRYIDGGGRLPSKPNQIQVGSETF